MMLDDARGRQSIGRAEKQIRLDDFQARGGGWPIGAVIANSSGDRAEIVNISDRGFRVRRLGKGGQRLRRKRVAVDPDIAYNLSPVSAIYEWHYVKTIRREASGVPCSPPEEEETR